MPFCFQQCGVLLATLILLLMGFVSRLCCYFLLKSAIITRRRTFEFLAFHVFGPAGKLAVEVGIIGFLMGTCIAYFVVVGDLGPQIIAKMFNINQSDILRTSIMVIVSLVCVLPLGLLRNVDSLSNVSAATICFYFCLVIKVILEATSQLLTADWHIRIETWKPSGVLQCVPIFSMALFCQTQLFEIFESLPSLSLEKMNVVTKNAINICTAVYFTLGFFGYVAFSSQNISGNILMSLSPTFASDVIKLGFVMSLAFSFPLIIFPCRASLYSFLYKKVHPAHHDHIINHSIPETTFRCITVAIVAAALFVSLLLPNIELVLGLVGSTIGVLVCVLFPAACFVSVTFKDTNERFLAKVILVLGLIILVLGTYANLQAAENKYDDKYITQERIDKMVEDFFEKQDKIAVIMPKADSKNNQEQKVVEDKVSNEMLKDSEVQPPNPIPPESQSNEKAPDAAQPADYKLAEEQAVKDTPKTVPETHPKDLRMKIEEAKLINGNSQAKVESSNIEKPEEGKEKKSKSDASQEKIDIMKKQQLIETIKQHGEEQKELIKEQKEILHEILKTKKELEKDKKEMGDTEAKKIAVESIQKIANMAIQSLSGVTDKPVGEIDTGVRKAEPLQKIANDAVHEIAKKAAETLEAIGEIKEPKEALAKSVDQPKENKNDLNIEVREQIIPLKIISDIKSDNNLNSMPEMAHQNEKASIESQNVNNIKKENIIIPSGKLVVGHFNENSKNDKGEERLQKEMNGIDNQMKAGKEQEIINREHSHSPDEPQSYKQGEDLANKVAPNAVNNVVAPNVPLPIALKGSQDNVKNIIQISEQNLSPNNVETNNDQQKIANDASGNVQNTVIKSNNAISEQPVQNNENNERVVPRQKREVVDCTEKTILKPEDKQICESLISNNNLLPSNVKLDLGLPLNPPMHFNIIQRSLKSYNEDDRRR
ncbi:unnamed protein product, partial [Iphiclides podalirius]